MGSSVRSMPTKVWICSSSALPLIEAGPPVYICCSSAADPDEAPQGAGRVDSAWSDQVTFVGRVPHAEVERYYSLIDLLAYPRHAIRLTELVTPLKPLEAMAQGRLLVASDVGGHRELIRDGETGVSFAPAALDRSPKRWCVLRTSVSIGPACAPTAAVSSRRERTWRASVQRYVGVYDRCREDGSIDRSGAAHRWYPARCSRARRSRTRDSLSESGCSEWRGACP